VMWCADLYARKQKLLTQWKHLLVPMVPVCGLVIALVVGQHDLGTALVLMAVMLGLIWIVGAPTRLFVATIGVVGATAAYFVQAEKYRMERVTSFLDPGPDTGQPGRLDRTATHRGNPAPAFVVRWFRTAADADRDRHAAVLREGRARRAGRSEGDQAATIRVAAVVASARSREHAGA